MLGSVSESRLLVGPTTTQFNNPYSIVSCVARSPYNCWKLSAQLLSLQSSRGELANVSKGRVMLMVELIPEHPVYSGL